MRQSGAGAVAIAPQSGWHLALSAAFRSSWRRVRLLVPTASLACAQSGSPNSALPTTARLQLPHARGAPRPERIRTRGCSLPPPPRATHQAAPLPHGSPSICPEAAPPLLQPRPLPDASPAQRSRFLLMETGAAFRRDSVRSPQPKRQLQQRGANHRSTSAPQRLRRRHHHRVTGRQRPVWSPSRGRGMRRRAAAANLAQSAPKVVLRSAKRAP